MTAGLTVGLVRARLVELWGERPALAEVAVGYFAPRGHFARDDGRGGLQVDTAERPVAVWLDGETDGQLELSAEMRGLPYPTREEWGQTVVVQVLPRDSDDDQASMELLLGDLIAEVVAPVAADPTLGLEAVAGGRVTVTPASFKWQAGPLGDRGSAARCELVLTIEADRC